MKAPGGVKAQYNPDSWPPCCLLCNSQIVLPETSPYVLTEIADSHCISAKLDALDQQQNITFVTTVLQCTMMLIALKTTTRRVFSSFREVAFELFKTKHKNQNRLIYLLQFKFYSSTRIEMYLFSRFASADVVPIEAYDDGSDGGLAVPSLAQMHKYVPAVSVFVCVVSFCICICVIVQKR